MFSTIDQAKPGLKKLIAVLGEAYPYASVLAVADDSRAWRISRGGINITSSGYGGGAGFRWCLIKNKTKSAKLLGSHRKSKPL